MYLFKNFYFFVKIQIWCTSKKQKSIGIDNKLQTP